MNIVRIAVGVVVAVVAGLIAIYILKLTISWCFVISGAASGIAMAIVPSRLHAPAYRRVD
jgi:hypothetical protein